MAKANKAAPVKKEAPAAQVKKTTVASKKAAGPVKAKKATQDHKPEMRTIYTGKFPITVPVEK